MQTQQYDTAAESIEMRLFRIDNQLQRLTRHFTKEDRNFNPEKVNWADDGSLGHVEELLTRVSDFVFQEGENAE